LAGGLLAGVYISHNVPGPTVQAIVIATTGIGSLLPDIDSKHSLINKLTGLGVISGLFGEHRGPTHSVLGMGLVGLLGTLVSKVVGLSLTAGYFTHLLLDSLTMSGVRWLYPSRDRLSFKVCRTGDVTDFILGAIGWGILVILAIKGAGVIHLSL
jgi:inner membrane protein